MEGVSVHTRTGRGILIGSFSIDTEIVRLSQGVNAIECACDEMKRQLLAQFREAHPDAHLR